MRASLSRILHFHLDDLQGEAGTIGPLAVRLQLTPQEAFYGREVITATREMVELESDEMVRNADTVDVAFLVVGDPLGYALCRRSQMTRANRQSYNPHGPSSSMFSAQHPNDDYPQCIHPHSPRIYRTSDVQLRSDPLFGILHRNMDASELVRSFRGELEDRDAHPHPGGYQSPRAERGEYGQVSHTH
jgi:hypothetical protein